MLLLLSNELAPAELAFSERHLNACRRCQELLERLAGDIELKTPQPVENETLCSPLLDTVKFDLVHGPFLQSSAVGRSDQDSVTPGLKGKLEPTTRAGALGRFGGYEILKLLGMGGMGVVYRALDRNTNLTVALKVLLPEAAQDKRARVRFLREAKYLSVIRHENVVGVYAVEEIKRTPCLVMEEVVGKSLEQIVKLHGAADSEAIRRIALEATRGLAAAHSRGILHRDLKPANIMVRDDTQQLKLADFGLAKTLQDVGLTASGCVPGTPEYMSPEQLSGAQVGFSTDLYSLGCVLYFLATGTNPFAAHNILKVYRNVCHVEVPSADAIIPGFDPRLAGVIASLMDKDPKQRPKDTFALVELLKNSS